MKASTYGPTKYAGLGDTQGRSKSTPTALAIVEKPSTSACAENTRVWFQELPSSIQSAIRSSSTYP